MVFVLHALVMVSLLLIAWLEVDFVSSLDCADGLLSLPRKLIKRPSTREEEEEELLWAGLPAL